MGKKFAKILLVLFFVVVVIRPGSTGTFLGKQFYFDSRASPCATLRLVSQLLLGLFMTLTPSIPV